MKSELEVLPKQATALSGVVCFSLEMYFNKSFLKKKKVLSKYIAIVPRKWADSKKPMRFPQFTLNIKVSLNNQR